MQAHQKAFFLGVAKRWTALDVTQQTQTNTHPRPQTNHHQTVLTILNDKLRAPNWAPCKANNCQTTTTSVKQTNQFKPNCQNPTTVLPGARLKLATKTDNGSVAAE